MAQFKEQGGVSTMDPPAYKRWIASQMLKNYVSFSGTDKRRLKEEKKRVKEKSPHRVEYFHYVDDPYSHLAAQILQAFVARYNIELSCYLVSEPPGDNAPELDMLMTLSRYDAHQIADYYGLAFAQRSDPPDKQLSQAANAILSAQDSANFIARAAQVGQALWTDDKKYMQALEKKYSSLASKLLLKYADSFSSLEPSSYELKIHQNVVQPTTGAALDGDDNGEDDSSDN